MFQQQTWPDGVCEHLVADFQMTHPTFASLACVWEPACVIPSRLPKGHIMNVGSPARASSLSYSS